jgi:hypothetical protein
MFSLFEGASLKIAKNLIKVTGFQESLALFQEKNLSSVGKDELLTQVLALNACNLLQTMKENFVDQEFDPEDRQDIVEDYVVENLRLQKWIVLNDGGVLMDKCQEILGISEKFRAHWMGEEDQTGPGPRYYCVKETLRKLGNEMNYALHDALFEFIYLQHKHFIHYFRTLLEPLENPAEPVPEVWSQKAPPRPASQPTDPPQV